MKKLLLLFVLMLSMSASANFIVIKSLAADGAGSLKQACENSNPYDTILINVSGTIQLVDPIEMTLKEDVTIIGAYPAHTKITATGIGNSIFDLNSCTNISISKVGFESTVVGTRAIHVASSSGFVQFNYCLFE